MWKHSGKTHGHRVNRKGSKRLHRLWDLPHYGARANLLSRRDKAEIGVLEVLYTDFTELRFAGGVRKAWLIPLLDHATRHVPGFAVGERANSRTGTGCPGRGGADPDTLPRLARRRDRPPGPGLRVHRLRVDRPASGGAGAALLRAPRAQGQLGDGDFFGRFQGGEPIADPRCRIPRGTPDHRRRKPMVRSDGVIRIDATTGAEAEGAAWPGTKLAAGSSAEAVELRELGPFIRRPVRYWLDCRAASATASRRSRRSPIPSRRSRVWRPRP